MNLKSLLLSSDEKTVRVLRRVLSDLEIDIEYCSVADDALRRITRQRFEAIIVDGSNAQEAGNILRAAKSAPVNTRALAIVLVEAPVGLKGGFEMGAHFVLHKPLAVERAKSSFRAVRALMKRERRLQLRIAVQIPVECQGAGHYKAKTIDLSEGGMAIQFSGRVAKENLLRFSLELPGTKQMIEISGELAWEGNGAQAGVRFKNATEEQRNMIRQWLNSQLPEPEQDDPPVNCRLTDLSLGGCYLTTSSPFPRGTRVILSIKTGNLEIHAGGVVLVAHPEFGMGVEFLQTTSEQRDHVHQMITTLRDNGDKTPELLVEPEGLETSMPGDSFGRFEIVATQASATEASGNNAVSEHEDALIELFRHKFEVPVETFLQQMREQRQSVESHSR
ncbi:MAG: PilZ domain-containing protein [Terriglobales bacterium]|jgi:c-di-GMP-binding flagellar brake protein YcgR